MIKFTEFLLSEEIKIEKSPTFGTNIKGRDSANNGKWEESGSDKPGVIVYNTFFMVGDIVYEITIFINDEGDADVMFEVRGEIRKKQLPFTTGEKVAGFFDGLTRPGKKHRGQSEQVFGKVISLLFLAIKKDGRGMPDEIEFRAAHGGLAKLYKRVMFSPEGRKLASQLGYIGSSSGLNFTLKKK